MTIGKDVVGAIPSEPPQTDDPLLDLLLSASEDDEATRPRRRCRKPKPTSKPGGY